MGAARKPLLDAARAARRSAVLRQASEEFCRKGVAAAELPQIARAVGLSRASLYNYCSGREDLARQCYLEALDSIDDMLAARPGDARTGLDRVVGFVRAAAGQGRPIAMIASELDLLPPDARAEIEGRQSAAFDGLAALIAAGQEDKSIRACDTAIAARSIWGLVFWAPLGQVWTGRAGRDLGLGMESEIPRIIEYGVVSDRIRHRVSAPIDPAVLDGIGRSRPGDRVEEIARTASMLFNRRGIEGVSLDDVAAEMGATKGLVYHHFDSKAALVHHCLDRGFSIYDQIMDVAQNAPDGAAQSRLGVALNAMAQLCALHPMSLNAFYHRLPEADRAKSNERAELLLDRAIGNVERGIGDGSQRACDGPAVALASAGSFLFLDRWLPKDRIFDSATVGEEVADLFMLGLAAIP